MQQYSVSSIVFLSSIFKVLTELFLVIFSKKKIYDALWAFTLIHTK